MVLTNIVGAAVYGKYTLIIYWITIFAVLGACGFPKLIVREVAKLNSRNQYRSIGILHDYIFWLGGSFSIFISIIGWIIITQFNLIQPEYHNLLRIGMLTVPFWTYILLYQALLKGSKHVILGMLPEYLIKPTLFFVLFLSCLAIMGKINAAVLLWCFFFTMFSVMLITMISFYRTEPAMRPVRTERHPVAEWNSAAFTFWLVSGVFIINSRVDGLVLGKYATDADLGVYSIAYKITDLVRVVLIVVNLVIAPEIAALFQNGEHDKLQRLIKKSIRWTFALSIPIAIVLGIGGPILLALFGKEFAGGYSVLVILIVVQLINVMLGSVGNILTMTGNEKTAFRIILLSLIINIILNLLLVPSMGINGAAIATGVSTIVWNVLMWYAVKQKVNINASIF